MKIHDRTYAAATNACLLVGVASAFGFDRFRHAAWIAAGICAAAVAIATYFVRHWQAGTDDPDRGTGRLIDDDPE